MMDRIHLPEVLQKLIEILESRERDLDIRELPDILKSDKKIISSLISDYEGRVISPYGEYVNVIPPLGHPGPCREILLVVIGTNNDVEKRILEAIEHIYAKCAGITKYVVFYAARWNQVSWIQHKNSFGTNITVVLKMPLAPPIKLS